MVALRSRLAWLLFALAAAAALAGWALSLHADEGFPRVRLDHDRPLPQGGLWSWAFEEPTDLNPLTTTEAVARRAILPYTHDAFMDWDPETGKPRPSLAISVETAGDDLIFRLREGVRFSDGSPLTVDDVLFTYRLAAHPDFPAGAVKQAVDLIESMTALDGETVRVRLARRYFAAVGRIATGLPIVQRAHFVAAVARLAGGESGADPEDPEFVALAARIRDPGPGTGPYAFVRDAAGELVWSHGRHLDIVQNPYSWRRTAHPRLWNLAGLRVRFLRDPAALLASVRRQRLDLYPCADPEALLRDDAELRAHYRAEVYDQKGLGHYMVVWNLRRPELGDARVRRALGMLFDRRAIADRLLSGHARPAVAWFKPGTPEYPADLEPLPFDPSRARGLLEEVGFGTDNPLEIEIVAPAELPFYRRTLDLAAPAFEAAGVRLRANAMEWSAVLRRLQAGDFQGMMLLKTHGDWIDPYPNFHSSQIGGSNWMGYREPEVDDLLERARVELDDGARQALFQRFSRIVHRDQPVTLLVHPLAAILIHRRFRDVQVGPLGPHPESCWIRPEDRLVPVDGG